MPFGGNRKSLAEMSEREFVAFAVAFPVVGGAIIAVAVIKALRWPSGFNTIWSAIMVVFVGCLVVAAVRGSIVELKRRRSSK